MDVGFNAKFETRADAYLDFTEIRKVSKLPRKVGDEYKWFWVMEDRQGTDHYVALDQYDIAFIMEG